MSSKLKVGFDLDGVLLYNPARIFRPITVGLKTIIKPKATKKTHFYYPRTFLEKWMWIAVHWSSLFISPGFDKVKTLANNGDIEAYIITSRYDCLKKDFQRWLKKMDSKKHFHATFHNKDNLQPHVFKEKMIKELGLEYFIEDNWDIVQHINKNTNAKALWISNAFDKHIDYELKFLSLKDAMDYIETKLRK
ncbi:hypothetical protein IPM65_04340 [Candidatus Roizmanbacteria bacterium]|nr:MAG: hypothetical protein IPM65_04340 [Candidatus Roizmanbacteria bacterium]